MRVAGSGATVLTEGNRVPHVTWQLPVTHSCCHLNSSNARQHHLDGSRISGFSDWNTHSATSCHF